MGEELEEFYPDEAALYELILDVFYERYASHNTTPVSTDQTFSDLADRRE